MVKVSSVEFQKNFGKYQDTALVEPVTVMRNGRDRIVLLSVEEYQRLKRRDRQVMSTADLPESDIAAIRDLHRQAVQASQSSNETE